MEGNEMFASDALNMLKDFPLLLPSNSFKYWEGMINLEGVEVFLNIDCPHYPSVEDLKIKAPAGFQSAVNNILKQEEHGRHRHLSDVLKILKQISILPVVTCSNSNDEYKKIWDISWFDKYEKVLKELKYIGTENVLKTDGTLTHLSLKKEDEYDFEHRIDIKLLDNYPLSKPVVEYVDLPDVALSKLMSCNTISEIFSKFCSLIASFQNFWFVYDELRRRSWVIDPENPKKRDTYCRIMIGSNISILISLNPLEVMSFPDIKFLGADKAVGPFRKILENNLKEFGWDMSNNFVDNLLTILGLEEFPQQPPTNDSQPNFSQRNKDNLLVADEECCICFMLRMDDNMLPTKICNNDKCTSVFHVSCLAQWFLSVPNNEPSFNLISGDCPHCGKRILCPVNTI